MIPTAEEFLRGKPFSIESIHSNMIEFAKIHVEAALKAAVINGEIDFEEYGGGIEGGEINGDSIINAYPLTLIK